MLSKSFVLQLTPNRRMAVYLERQRYANNQDLKHLVSNPETSILPIHMWLEELYTAVCSKHPYLPTLLSAQEEYLIWEKIVKQSEWGQTLLKTSGAALAALDAWNLCIEWQLPFLDFKNLSIDTQIFLEWVQDYQTLCKESHWVGLSMAIELLLDCFSSKEPLNDYLPKEIELIGFETLTPQYAYFFKKIENLGIAIQHRKLISNNLNQSKEKRRICLAALNPEEELILAATQASIWLKEKETFSIGVVIPDLEKRQREVTRIFEEKGLKGKLNVAAPPPLAHHPLIKAALMVIQWLNPPISLESFSLFLRSPFFADASIEIIPRMMVDVLLREWNEAECSLDVMISRLKQAIELQHIPKCPTLIKSLQAFALICANRWAQQLPQSSEVWSTLFISVLESLGWPGERSLNEEEIKIQKQWDQLITQYIKMDRVLGLHSCQEAVVYLKRLMDETAYSPYSSEAPVQVLGLLEAIGIPFDYLWVTGMQRETWPKESAPNPFIPLSLQRAHDLPRSSAERELKMATLFTERLSESAGTVIFSYAAFIDDKESAPTRLLDSVPGIQRVPLEALKLSIGQSYLEKISQKKPFAFQKKTLPIFLPEDRAPKLSKNEKVPGGSRVLKLQAACPFRAFAEIRLQANPIPQLRVGLSPAERGEIVHQVLQYFWQGIPNQDVLKALSEEGIQQRLKKSMDTVIAKWQQYRSNTLTPKYAKLEKKRLLTLIMRYVELEKSRPFFEIASIEEESSVDLSGLRIKIRIDRIDRLANGQEIVIDYKTGEPSIRDWFSDRPEDPQLPLYCISRKQEPWGMIFGVLRPDKIKYQGLTKESNQLPGVKAFFEMSALENKEATWGDQCMRWKTTLSSLAEDFSHGVAVVDPVAATTCRFCTLGPLCRVKSLNI